MHTTNQFETALLAIKVQIDEIKTPNGKVREAIGYKDGKRLTWNESGQCFFHKVRMPENDLKFEEQTPENDEAEN
jgi:hypothetical protein